MQETSFAEPQLRVSKSATRSCSMKLWPEGGCGGEGGGEV